MHPGCTYIPYTWTVDSVYDSSVHKYTWTVYIHPIYLDSGQCTQYMTAVYTKIHKFYSFYAQSNKHLSGHNMKYLKCFKIRSGFTSTGKV